MENDVLIEKKKNNKLGTRGVHVIFTNESRFIKY